MLLYEKWKANLSRAMVIDFMDRLAAAALKSHHVIRDHSGLNKQRRSKAEGMVRFPMLEQSFEEVCTLFGGDLIGPVIFGTDWKIFQPFFRFGGKENGMVIGLASMPEPGKLPTQNLSRKSGVKLNDFQTARLDLDGKGPRSSDTFALILVSRDRALAGHLEVMAVGVIDAKFSEFLYYETLDKFLEGITDAPEDPVAPTQPQPTKPTLRKGIKPYVPSEQIGGDDQEKTK